MRKESKHKYEYYEVRPIGLEDSSPSGATSHSSAHTVRAERSAVWSR